MNNSIPTNSELIMLLVNSFYILILIFQIFIVRSFQKYNDIMPVRKKIDVSILYGIPISTIISSLLMAITMTSETNNGFIVWLFILGSATFAYSFLSILYCLIYFSYQTRKEINRVFINNKCKWYQDETGFYASILFVLSLFAPFIYFFIFSNKSLATDANEIMQQWSFLYTLTSFYMIFYLFSLRKTRAHFDKVIMSYIEVCAAEEINSAERESYKNIFKK